jgi:hypothetical protein
VRNKIVFHFSTTSICRIYRKSNGNLHNFVQLRSGKLYYCAVYLVNFLDCKKKPLALHSPYIQCKVVSRDFYSTSATGLDEKL